MQLLHNTQNSVLESFTHLWTLVTKKSHRQPNSTRFSHNYAHNSGHKSTRTRSALQTRGIERWKILPETCSQVRKPHAPFRHWRNGVQPFEGCHLEVVVPENFVQQHQILRSGARATMTTPLPQWSGHSCKKNTISERLKHFLKIK